MFISEVRHKTIDINICAVNFEYLICEMSFISASFIIQFFILSFLIGIPLFTLYLCLGQVLESGPVDMWRISPIFQGVGISLLLTQAVIGMYSIIGLSWIFVYFRDSFITSDDKYKWALPHEFGFEGKTGTFVY